MVASSSVFRVSIVLLIAVFSLLVKADDHSIQELVAGVDPEAIHAALHETTDGKYKHGVFEGDRAALEVVHRSSPTEATRIVQLARQKRQSNVTVTSHEVGIHTSTTILSTRTTTLANGARSTVTDITVVVPTDNSQPVESSSPAETTQAATTTSGTPALQTNEAGHLAVSGGQKVMLAALTFVGVAALAL